MKYFLLFNILFYIHSNLCSNEFVMDVSGKQTVITEHNYSDDYFFRAIKLDGAFTDNFGNYGDFDSFVTVIMKQGNIYKVDFSNKFTLQNNKSYFMEGQRKQGGKGTGVGEAIVISANSPFEDLLNCQCVYGIKYFQNTFFSKMKCKINDAALKEMKNIKETTQKK